MASFWIAVFKAAGCGGAGEKGLWVIMAGIRSALYLTRQKRWSVASILLEQAFKRDSSPDTIASVLPLIRYIAKSVEGTDQEFAATGIMADALNLAGRWQEAEEMIRILIPKCLGFDAK
jgi:hypothetical protein